MSSQMSHICFVIYARPTKHLCFTGHLSRYVDQGGGKRPGAFAVYIEPWHADVFEVLDMKKNHGKDELRAR